MKKISYAILCINIFAAPLAAQEFPPGVIDAQLLPGWIDEDGNRVSALKLNLEPGWKTYWRNPGDSGLPPSFDWQRSTNLKAVEFHWPTPEVILSEGEQTLGYHDVLVLPFTVTPVEKSKPIDLNADIALGVCEKICVPANLSLTATEAGDGPNAEIETALADAPKRLTTQPECRVEEIKDGMQVIMDLPKADLQAVAMELVERPDVWVSSAKFETVDNNIRATADFIEPSGKPFDLDVSQLRVTQIGVDDAYETIGCKP